MDSLPHAKASIKEAIERSVTFLSSTHALTDELREFFEIAYVSLAEYLEPELLALVVEYRRAAEQLYDQPRVARLIDWLIEKQQSGYGMLNSVQRLAEMKQFVKGAHNEPWNCRAGMNTVIIRVDGTLAHCFPMYSATHDWGVVGAHKFDAGQLKTMKTTCEPNCYSTLNHIVGWCYNDGRVLRWIVKQARHGFQGVRGNLE